MKYRYLILPDNGDVWGTNDVQVALTAAANDLVLDAETAEMIDEDGDREAIEEYQPPEEGDLFNEGEGE